jgi:hypothetical protein
LDNFHQLNVLVQILAQILEKMSIFMEVMITMQSLAIHDFIWFGLPFNAI